MASDNSATEKSMHVVVVDDDPLFLRTFTTNVENAGYKVSAFGSGRSALAVLLTEQAPTACILDWHMPDMSGLELLRYLKAANFNSPVMFLTGLNHPQVEETAFDQGAVEFVEKTRSLAVILKRLERMIAGDAARHSQDGRDSPDTIELGPLVLNHLTKRASWKGHQVSLSVSEFEVTALLAAHAGSDVAYRRIYDVIQDVGFLGGRGPEGYRTNVRAAIKRIRKKFIDIDPGFDALENYPGFGYRWRPS